MNRFVWWNYKQHKILNDWIKDYFTARDKQTPRYAILHGLSGNGKTSTVYALAKEFNLDVYRISSDVINGKESLNTCIKKLNLQSMDNLLTNDIKGKIVLVDDVDFSYATSSIKNKLFKIYETSDSPVIYTCSDRYKLPKEFTKGNSIVVKVNRLMRSDLIDLVKEERDKLKLDVDNPTIRNIVDSSKTNRGALLSLWTSSNNKSFNPSTNLYETIDCVRRRSLSQDLDYRTLLYICKNIRTYNKEDCLILNRLAEFDYMYWRGKERDLGFHLSETIDKFLINNMLEPIDKLKITRQNQKRETISKPEVVKEVEKKQVKIEPTSINDFF